MTLQKTNGPDGSGGVAGEAGPQACMSYSPRAVFLSAIGTIPVSCELVSIHHFPDVHRQERTPELLSLLNTGIPHVDRLSP